MANGLIINEHEFRSLPQKEQLLLLYQNQVKTLEVIKGYKIYYKLTSIIGGILVFGMGILYKLQIPGT